MTCAAIAIVAASLASLASASCTVRRQSERYACGSDGDCDDGRACDSGYCVPAPCPSQCTTCSIENRTCNVVCNANRPCPAIECPTGYACTIRCNNASACGLIDCEAARSCDIDCTGPGSCGAIQCGAVACAIECSGNAGCALIDCAGSCACDVRCNNPAACPIMACPEIDGTLCTQDGEPGAPCDSSEANVCDSCS